MFSFEKLQIIALFSSLIPVKLRKCFGTEKNLYFFKKYTENYSSITQFRSNMG